MASLKIKQRPWQAWAVIPAGSEWWLPASHRASTVQLSLAPIAARCLIPRQLPGGPFSSDPVGNRVCTPGPRAPPKIQQNRVPLAPGLTLEPWRLGSVS